MKMDKYKQIRACWMRTGRAVKYFHSQSSFISVFPCMLDIIDLDLELGFQPGVIYSFRFMISMPWLIFLLASIIN